MGNAQEPFIDVMDTNEEWEADVVRGLLESNGIEVLKTSIEAPGDVLPFTNSPLGHIRLQVLESSAEEASKIIEGYRNQGATTPEEAEAEANS